MTIITRFAPSPTGLLHIGSARTALFNYLYAKKNNGKFLLRVEDTDRQRSTEIAEQAILSGMKWLGLEYDEEIVYQHKQIKKHQEIIKMLVQSGHAYHCFLSDDEVNQLKTEFKNKNKAFRSPWRDKTNSNNNVSVIRMKVPDNIEISFNDHVQGNVNFNSDQIDDFVLMRSDNTPTYMLAVVADDHDMKVNYIIRGDDHLVNTPKQILIYKALNWQIPNFAHIPLIHGDDGAKLSKRHGALGVEEYMKMGYLPEAINNYLLRLGWSHGNDELITREEAIKLFNIESIGKAPARMDFKKMDFINAHYINHMTDAQLISHLRSYNSQISSQDEKSIIYAADIIKSRAKNLNNLTNEAKFFLVTKNFKLSQNQKEKLNCAIYTKYQLHIQKIDNWDRDKIFQNTKDFSKDENIKLNEIAKLLRIALTGEEISPSVFDIMHAIGRDESMKRILNP